MRCIHSGKDKSHSCQCISRKFSLPSEGSSALDKLNNTFQLTEKESPMSLNKNRTRPCLSCIAHTDMHRAGIRAKHLSIIREGTQEDRCSALGRV